MSHQTTAWAASPAYSAVQPAEYSTDPATLPAWLANLLLILASAVLFALACASAWLSYHAQVDYVRAHNGGRATEARVWALLLDTGTAGVSLLRLYETLWRQIRVSTCFSLAGCIAASMAMNILHTPSRTPGGYLVAAVPPLMYAVFLEHLLANLRSLLIADQERRSVWRRFLLWLNFPSLMWSTWRSALRCVAEGSLPTQKHEQPCESDVSSGTCTAPRSIDGAKRKRSGAVGATTADSAVHRPRRGRGPGPKRVEFETALALQLRAGDLRLFSKDERERNSAAYEAAASLPAPLSPGTARRYVVEALPRLAGVGQPSAKSHAESMRSSQTT